MDYHKDILQSNETSKGQESPKALVDASYNSTNGNPSLLSLTKRTERLVTALYMVTDCIDNSDPLKQASRTLGLSMLKDTAFLALQNAVGKNNAFAEFKHGIDHMISLVTIATTVGLVSQMNGDILIKEFNILKDSLLEIEIRNKAESFQSSQFEKSAFGSFALSPDFLHGEALLSADTTLAPVLKNPSFYKGHNNPKGQIKNNTQSQKNLTDGIPDQKNKSHKTDIGLKLARRNNILAIIKDRKEVTIKDITMLIKDCSEKTIQRELLALVSEGVLKKAGDKRWSRYALN